MAGPADTKIGGEVLGACLGNACSLPPDPNVYVNDWLDPSSPLYYQPAEAIPAQEPSLAEVLDENDDGILTPEEYYLAGDHLREYGLPDTNFGLFKLFAESSISDPLTAEKTGMAGIILPHEVTNQSDPSQESAYRVATQLLSMAADESDYETAVSYIAQAGQVFIHIGFTREARRCHRMMVERARDAGRTDDAAFHMATAAMGEGNIGEIERLLKDIPEGYEGREILANYAATYRRMEAMSYTFAGAQALAQVYMTEGEKEVSLLGKVVWKRSFDDSKEVISSAMSAWQERLQSGRFNSTREILDDIWRNDEHARAGLWILSGQGTFWNLGGDPPAAPPHDLWNWLAPIGQHVMIGDLIDQEETPDPAAFQKRLGRVCQRTGLDDRGTRAVLEAASVATVFRNNPRYKSQMDAFMSAEFEDPSVGTKVRNFVHRNSRPENVAIMIGGYALARLTLASIMAGALRAGLLPAATEALTFTARTGVAAAEAVVEAGAFTLYQRTLAEFLTSQEVDWSAKSIGRDWAALAIGFGFLRATAVPLTALRQKMGRAQTFANHSAKPVIIAGREVPALTTTGEVVYRVTQNVAQTGAFYTGGWVSYGLNFHDQPPEFFEEWLNILYFQAGVKLANVATKGWVDRKAYELRTRPVIEAAQRVAEGMVGRPGPEADALAQRIYLAHVRGNVSSRSLTKLGRAFKKGESSSNDIIEEANAVLDRTGLDLLYDGARLHVVPPRKGVSSSFELRLDSVDSEYVDDVMSYFEGRPPGATIRGEDLTGLARHLIQGRKWSYQKLQNFLSPEGMHATLGYGIEIPFGFESRAQYDAFQKMLMTELLAYGIPIHDPAVQVMVQGSSVTGRKDAEGNPPYRWVKIPGATDKAGKKSDLDIAVVVTPEIFARLVVRRVQWMMSERGIEADFQTSAVATLKWLRGIDTGEQSGSKPGTPEHKAWLDNTASKAETRQMLEAELLRTLGDRADMSISTADSNGIEWWQPTSSRPSATRSRPSIKLESALARRSISNFDTDGAWRQTHGRLRDQMRDGWEFERDIQISFMLPGSRLFPAPDETILISAEALYLACPH